jgi:hypothetical protein
MVYPELYKSLNEVKGELLVSLIFSEIYGKNTKKLNLLSGPARPLLQYSDT